MQRIKRSKPDKMEEIESVITNIKELLKKISITQSMEAIRGIEGSAAKQYFSVFRYHIQPAWALFPCRSKNPPCSNVNAVLSFLYTVLTVRIETALEAQGLDPMVGTLHTTTYGTAALAFDLVEELRIPVVDTLCCRLFNHGILLPNDFETHHFHPESMDYPCEYEQEAVLLSEEGLKKVIAAFEEKMNKRTITSTAGERISYNMLIHQQIHIYKKMLNGERHTYTPYYFK